MLTPETIANKTFRRTLLGYDLEQVDDFLDEIILHLQQLERERKEMSDTIDRLATEIRRLTPDNGHEPEPEETVAFPMSPHGVVVSSPPQEKAARAKEKKAKPIKGKPAEGKKKAVREDEPEKGKNPVKGKKPVRVRKPEPEQKPEKPLAAKPVESQEETKRFRLTTEEVASVKEPVPAEEEPVVEETIADEIAAEKIAAEEPAVEETVQNEPIAEEPTAQEEPEQAREDAHEQE